MPIRSFELHICIAGPKDNSTAGSAMVSHTEQGKSIERLASSYRLDCCHQKCSQAGRVVGEDKDGGERIEQRGTMGGTSQEVLSWYSWKGEYFQYRH